MEKLSKFIVKYRKIILIISIILLVPSVFGYLHTKVNYDILSYLPADSESMQGQDILDKDFNLSSVDMLVVNGMKDKDVLKLKEQIQNIEGVDKVVWRDDVTDISLPKEAIPENIQMMLPC